MSVIDRLGLMPLWGPGGGLGVEFRAGLFPEGVLKFNLLYLICLSVIVLHYALHHPNRQTRTHCVWLVILQNEIREKPNQALIAMVLY